MPIGTKIKKLRELRNFTQDYMAKQLKMSQGGYSKIERDEVSVDFDKLSEIAKVLDINVTDIVNFDEKIVFNNYASNNLNLVNNQYNLNDKEYEEKIKFLEEKLRFKDEIINELKEKLKNLGL